MENKTHFLNQLNDIITQYNTLKLNSNDYYLADCPEEVAMLIAKSKAAVSRIVGINSTYYKEIERALEKKEYDGMKLKQISGVAIALKEDLEKDYMKNLGELIHSEVFADFLDMAQYLLGEGYKDAAAVIAGSTLESHLKKLCLKNGIAIQSKNSKGAPVPRKADVINADLAGTPVPTYSKGIQKQITAWLDIRNNAAHGDYAQYNQDQVKLMISGITDFIATNPA